MDQSAINEGNALIAEKLLGWYKDENAGENVYRASNEKFLEFSHYHIKELKFHFDWNWLMVAVDKIEKEINETYQRGGHRVVIEQYRCVITHPFIDIVAFTKKSATYKAVIAYIKKIKST